MNSLKAKLFSSRKNKISQKNEERFIVSNKISLINSLNNDEYGKKQDYNQFYLSENHETKVTTPKKIICTPSFLFSNRNLFAKSKLNKIFFRYDKINGIQYEIKFNKKIKEDDKNNMPIVQEDISEKLGIKVNSIEIQRNTDMNKTDILNYGIYSQYYREFDKILLKPMPLLTKKSKINKRKNNV